MNFWTFEHLVMLIPSFLRHSILWNTLCNISFHFIRQKPLINLFQQWNTTWGNSRILNPMLLIVRKTSLYIRNQAGVSAISFKNAFSSISKTRSILLYGVKTWCMKNCQECLDLSWRPKTFQCELKTKEKFINTFYSFPVLLLNIGKVLLSQI